MSQLNVQKQGLNQQRHYRKADPRRLKRPENLLTTHLRWDIHRKKRESNTRRRYQERKKTVSGISPKRHVCALGTRSAPSLQ
ncbi:hypothetical protein FKM82_022304 [Ascaphus truei]